MTRNTLGLNVIILSFIGSKFNKKDRIKKGKFALFEYTSPNCLIELLAPFKQMHCWELYIAVVNCPVYKSLLKLRFITRAHISATAQYGVSTACLFARQLLMQKNLRMEVGPITSPIIFVNLSNCQYISEFNMAKKVFTLS